MMPQDAKYHIKPMFFFWSMEDLAQARRRRWLQASPKLASRVSRTLKKEEFDNYFEHAFTHQGGLADLEAAAATADPLARLFVWWLMGVGQ